MNGYSLEFLFYAAMAVVATIIILALIADMGMYLFKGNCYHKWCEWGEPVQEKQYRLCQKCKMVERRYL